MTVVIVWGNKAVHVVKVSIPTCIIYKCTCSDLTRKYRSVCSDLVKK